MIQSDYIDIQLFIMFFMGQLTYELFTITISIFVRYNINDL